MNPVSEDPGTVQYAPDTTQRVFRYAVPLSGLSNDDTDRLIGHSEVDPEIRTAC